MRILGIGQPQLHHHKGSAGLYRMWSQHPDGRSPLRPNLEIYCLGHVYTNSSARWDTDCAIQQNTLGRYIRRITVNVIEAYHIAKNIRNVLI